METKRTQQANAPDPSAEIERIFLHYKDSVAGPVSIVAVLILVGALGGVLWAMAGEDAVAWTCGTLTVIVAVTLSYFYWVLSTRRSKEDARSSFDSLLAASGMTPPQLLSVFLGLQGILRDVYGRPFANLIWGAQADSEWEMKLRLAIVGRQAQLCPPKRVLLDTVVDYSPLQFERWVGQQLEKAGYTVICTPGSGDGGVDVKASREEADRVVRLVVQCKRYKTSAQLGPAVVREVYGAMLHEKATGAVIVTTASFSDGAKAFARGKPITLVSGCDINFAQWPYHLLSE